MMVMMIIIIASFEIYTMNEWAVNWLGLMSTTHVEKKNEKKFRKFLLTNIAEYRDSQ